MAIKDSLSSTVYKTKNDKAVDKKVISLRLLEEILGWLVVLILGVIMIFTHLIILDPLLLILIKLYVQWAVVKNLKQTALLFLQAVPKNLDTKIRKALSILQ